MLLDGLTAMIDELETTDPNALAAPETIVGLHRQLDRLEAISTRAAACFDTGGAWQLDGARTAASWIAVRTNCSRSAAKREISLGRALRHLPACETAWLAGDIGAEHVQVLAHLRCPTTERQLADDESMLVGHAKALKFHHFQRVVAYWAQHADPDGQDRDAEVQRSARRFHLSQSIDRLWFGDAVFDPLSGTVLSQELTRIETELFEADWADARHRLGRVPSAADLLRTPAQRRADAMVEMAIRSRIAPADGRRPEPLFTVLVGWETFSGRICELANGTVVSPSVLVPWLKSAWLERVVFASPSRVSDVGVARRLFTGATRRAIEVRDQECFHQMCDIAADNCQVDHIIPYSAGGPTTQANGRLACGFHNRARHRQPP